MKRSAALHHRRSFLLPVTSVALAALLGACGLDAENPSPGKAPFLGVSTSPSRGIEDDVHAAQNLPVLAAGKRAVLAHLAAVTKLDSARLAAVGLEVTRSERAVDFEGRTVRHLRLTQTRFGLPVVAGDLVAHLDDATQTVEGVEGASAEPTERPADAALAGEAALAQALGQAQITGRLVEAPALTYLATASGATRLTWSARVAYDGPEGPEVDRVFASAVSGDLLARHPQIHRALSRRVYSAGTTQNLPGTLLGNEGATLADAAAKAAYDNAGLVHKYYADIFGRDSYNGAGAQLVSTVHFDVKLNNAFWDGTQMVYGDGDGTNFKNLALGFDVVAHELTHAVTTSTANLVYQGEPGALNEAWSDIMAAAAEAHVDGDKVSADTWLIGEDIFTPNVAGDGLRYMMNPTADGISPDNFAQRYTGTEDNGGVHLNSGIANLAFGLLVQGGKHPRAKTVYEVPAFGMDKAEQIFFKALTAYMTPNTTFAQARTATVKAAQELYGEEGASAVHYAWDAVGVAGTPTRAAVSLGFDSPADGDQVGEGFELTTLVSEGNALDVARAELYVNDALAATSTEAPFTFLDVAAPLGTAALELRTYDRSGNMKSTTASVSVVKGGGGDGDADGDGTPDSQDPDGPYSEAPGLCSVSVGGHGAGSPWFFAMAAVVGVAFAARRRGRRS